MNYELITVVIARARRGCRRVAATRVATRAARVVVRGSGAASRLGIHRVVVSLLEDDVLQQRDGIDVPLLDAAVLLLLLSDHDALRLGLEEHAARGDGGCRAVLHLVDADARESDLEDADAVEFHLLPHLEEVLQCASHLVEHGLDVRLLHRGLGLDELRQLLGLDEAVVVHRRGEVLTEGLVVLDLVL